MLWTTWDVLFKPYAADACNFISREEHRFDSTDDQLYTAVDAILKEKKVVDCIRDLESWSIAIHELPELPPPKAATPNQLKKAYEGRVTDAYLGDCPKMGRGFSAGQVGKPRNLALIIYHVSSEPQHRPLSRPLSPVHEEINPRMMRDAVASAGQKCQPPSTGAKASELAITQTSTFEAAIHDGRPLSLLGAPLAIYSEAFTQFRATMSDETLQFDPTELSSARRLVDKAAKHTPKEELRVEAMVDLSSVHREILVEVTLQLSTNPPKKIIPDGRICATSEFQHVEPILSLTEVKSEIGGGTCDPIDKAKQDYRAIYCSEKFKPFRDVSCCPCLLVAIAGPNIMVGGAVYAEQIIATSFTSYISIAPLDVSGPRPMYDAAIWRAARLMYALKKTITALNEHYTAVTKAMNAARLASRLPTAYVGPHLTKVSAPDGTEISLTYTGRLCLKQAAKAVFTARASIDPPPQGPSSFDAIVKFTKTYSPEGHRLLEAQALAPKLYFCEWVASVDMYVVVMEHVRNAESTESVENEVRMSAKDIAAVRKAVQLLHSNELVFGDLRRPNVLLREDGGPLLVDFDWCGAAGQARYPLSVNMDSQLQWHPDVDAHELIKYEHDEHMFKVLTGRPFKQ